MIHATMAMLRRLRPSDRSAAVTTCGACGVGAALAMAALTPSAAAQEIVLRQSFPFGGSTAVTDGTYGFAATRTPTTGENSGACVTITAPQAGYVSRVEVRVNGAFQPPNFGVFFPWIALHSSNGHAGASSNQGDLGTWTAPSLPNALLPAGTTGWGDTRFETFFTPTPGTLTLQSGQTAILAICFWTSRVDPEDGTMIVAETNRPGSFNDIVTGVCGNYYCPNGWSPTSIMPTRLFSGELAMNVYFTPTATCTAPTITTQPQPAATCPTGSAAFTVAADGTAPAYQWQIESAPASNLWNNLVDGPLIINNVTYADLSGTRTSTLHVEHASGSMPRRIRSVVTNSCGNATSDPATLTLSCPNKADIARLGGALGCDGTLSVDDLIVFLGGFFANAPYADLATLGGGSQPDGQFTVDDVIAFLSAFFAGCP